MSRSKYAKTSPDAAGSSLPGTTATCVSLADAGFSSGRPAGKLPPELRPERPNRRVLPSKDRLELIVPTVV